MKGQSSQPLFAGVALLGAAVALAGCTGTTYGTGVSAGRQTIQDLSGIAALNSGTDEEEITYEPRPPIVAPPADAAGLPPPGSGGAALASNWPRDPDQEAARLKAARGETIYNDENLPRNSRDPYVRVAGRDSSSREPIDRGIDPAVAARTTPEQREAAKKLYADSRGLVSVDEQGRPVRQYLSDPPVEYQLHDPDSPVEVTDEPEKKRRFKWPWEWFD